MKYIPLFYSARLIVIVLTLSIIGCGDDNNGIYQPQGKNTPRVIAVEPKPGSTPTEAVELDLRQDISITFNEPVIPNSGRIMFGSGKFGYQSVIRLQDTTPVDTITWNICLRQIELEPDTLVVSDFQNVNGDVQPHAFVGWYWMPLIDPGPPQVLEHFPIGHEVDPEITRFIRVVFNQPLETAICQITPAITLSPTHIENDSITSCTAVLTWEFVGSAQLDYSTQYEVNITAEDFAGAGTALENYSFTTKAVTDLEVVQ